MDNQSMIQGIITLLGGGFMVGLGALLKAWVDKSRVDHVEGPRTAAEAWQIVFQTMQQQVSDLTERVAKLETSLVQRNAEIEERDGIIRRLRSYMAILMGLLQENDIIVPDAPHDVTYFENGVAPERRHPTTSVTLVDSTERADLNVRIENTEDASK